MTPLHAAALAYAAQGVPIFPLHPGTKQPATAHSFKDATTDYNMVDSWWAYADYNIGTEPAASGQCVIDIDNKAGKSGTRAWTELCDEHGDPPETRMVRTPNSGWHIYFTGALPPSVNRLGDGIDVRSLGSYVVLPPSVLPEGVYWALPYLTVAPLPAWITASAGAARHEAAVAPADVEIDPEGVEEWAIKLIEDEIDANGPAEEGNGVNDRRFRLACKLKDGPRHGVTVSEGLACELLAEHWVDAPRTGQTVRNAYRLSGQNAPGCGPVGDPMRKYGSAYLEQDAPKRIAGHFRNSKERTPVAIEWLWPGYLARGKLHILGGGKGDGKSTLMFDLFARITKGSTWPDGVPAPLGDVLIWSGEDDIDDTILPRFMVAGGDRDHYYPVDKVVVGGVKRPFDPARDMPVLLQAARELPNLTAILIDPVVSAVGGDSHNNAETRRGLQPLVDLAIETRAALIGITHFTKNTQGRSPIERITGSLAFGAVPRVVLGTAKVGEARRLVRIASNIGGDGGGFEYLLRQAPLPGYGFDAQRVVWGNQLAGSPEELLAAPELDSKGLKSILFLERMLGEAGTAGVPVKALKAAAEAHSVSWPTVERAKSKMGNIRAFQNVGATNGGWNWALVVAV